jgi:hypothetical protein
MARSCRCTAPRQTNARLAHLINARPRLRSGRTKLAIVRSALRALERNVACSWRADHCAGGTAQVAHGLAHRSSHSHCATTSSNATTCCAACGRAKRAIPPVVRALDREMVMACGSSPRQRKDGVIWYRRNGGIHAAIKKQYQPRSKNSGIRHAPSMFGCADCLGKFRDAAHIRAYFISGCNRRRLVQGGRQTNEDSRS